ncbi:LuxR C-terminal-related transcriptional regulator [Flavobacteriaceae bacterium S356]|uniref:LuxR C-terminal-related transcriptional regulator n=1 Tax=Asprobacillus argus TaxID=3076534 RepID=A0ABU3LCC8_9FLAO|nr:LuxR C-terminal-related transcriptional regulator [Flavobacteriaceae bacterium S356]
MKRKRVMVYDLYYVFKRNQLQYQESLDIILKNIEYKKELNDPCGLSKSYRGLSAFWRIQKDYKKALLWIEKSLTIAKEQDCRKEEVRSTMALSNYYLTNKDYDKSLETNMVALDLAKKYNDIGGVANANYQIAKDYNLKKKFEKSLSHLNKAENGFKKTENISALERVNSTRASYYRKIGAPKKAIIYYKKAITYNLKLRDSSRLMYRYLGLSNSYRDIKDFKNAYYSYLNYKGMQKKVNDKKEYRKLVELETRLAYKNQKRIDSIQFAQQKALDEQKIKEDANTRFWLYVLALSTTLVVVLIFYILNKQRIKEQAYQNILLNKKVAYKSEEIDELLKETLKHVRSKEKLTMNLQKFSREEEGVTLQSILSDLKASKVDDTKFLLIKQNIEKINSEFIQALKEKHPNLTKTEVEVCLFIKVGLSRKEIAEVRSTSEYAVKTMRNRVRKKIHVNANITLDDYLNSLS